MKRIFRYFAAAVFGVCGVCAGGPAGAQSAPSTSATSASADPALSALLAGRQDALGRRCELLGDITSAQSRYLACGNAGVWVVHKAADGRLSLVGQQDLQGSVTGLFVRDGQLWAQVASLQARPIAAIAAQDTAQTAPLEQPVSPLPQAMPPPAVVPPRVPPEPLPVASRADVNRKTAASSRVYKVVSQSAGLVVVNMGLNQGLHDGERIAFYARTRDTIEPGQDSSSRTLLAVGEIEAISTERARVRLGLDERVPLGSEAQASRAPLTGGALAPPRLDGVWSTGFLARPFLVLENIGGGVVVDGHIGYRDAHGFHYEALLQPAALASAEQGTSVPAAAVLTASYDARWFAVGFGLGGQTINDPVFDLNAGSGVTFVQRMRLGALDGLKLEAFSYVALFHSEFSFSSLRIEGQIPLTQKAWLLLAGSGGDVGVSHGELGLRVLLVGNGDRDSVFFSVVIGGVNVVERDWCQDPFGQCPEVIDYAGPMVGAGAEWRF